MQRISNRSSTFPLQPLDKFHWCSIASKACEIYPKFQHRILDICAEVWTLHWPRRTTMSRSYGTHDSNHTTEWCMSCQPGLRTTPTTTHPNILTAEFRIPGHNDLVTGCTVHALCECKQKVPHVLCYSHQRCWQTSQRSPEHPGTQRHFATNLVFLPLPSRTTKHVLPWRHAP